jgi:hypothetical protein
MSPGINYLDTLQDWLMPHLTKHYDRFTFQQDGNKTGTLGQLELKIKIG